VLLVAAQDAPLSRVAQAAENAEVIADNECGKIRGSATADIKVFKGIPYGANTQGKNRFMPPVKAAAWTGVRDALGWGPTAPQNGGTGNGRGGNRPAERRLPDDQRLHTLA
jgi:para-nitrobenzyl esterase